MITNRPARARDFSERAGRPGRARAREPLTRATKGSVAPPGAQDATRKRSGVLALLQHDLAPDDDVMHAFRALHAPGRAGRSVVSHLVLLDADGREIEHHEVGRQAFADQPTIAQPQDARGLEGEPPDGVFERQELAVADPLAQDVARLAGGAEVRVEMRPGVRL